MHANPASYTCSSLKHCYYHLPGMSDLSTFWLGKASDLKNVTENKNCQKIISKLRKMISIGNNDKTIENVNKPKFDEIHHKLESFKIFHFSLLRGHWK